MKKVKENIIKGIVTSIIGIITMIVTLILVFRGDMDFVWNGIAGLSIGAVLLMAPKTIEKTFISLFDKFSGGNTKVSKNSSKDEVPSPDPE